MKNKQKGFVVPLVIIIGLLVVGAGIYYLKSSTDNKTVQEDENLKTYTNPRFSFRYPSDWNMGFTDSGVYVLTKEHDTDPSPSGKSVDFSVSVCDLTTNSLCRDKKQELGEVARSYAETQDTNLTLDGKAGQQFVMAGSAYYFTAVIEDKGTLYVLGSSVEDYETRYPQKFSDAQVKAIFDSFKFAD